jgi:hypothetical protein
MIKLFADRCYCSTEQALNELASQFYWIERLFDSRLLKRIEQSYSGSHEILDIAGN